MLNQVPVIKEKEGAVPLQWRGGDIELRNVGFKHLLTGNGNAKQDQEATIKQDYLFKSLSLKIKSGTSNAIVGHSGFGKTTMINMINRIYDPSEGDVYIDGQNLRDLTFESYRKYISVIP